MRMRIIHALIALISVLVPACSRSGAPPTARMGENLRVGSLTYNVTETQWADQLPDSSGTRSPSHRFLTVRLSVTNNGDAETIIPAMSLVDTTGTVHNELTDGSGVANWMGMLRRINPAETETGSVLFDVPVGAYTLQVYYEHDDPDREVFGRIELPMRFEGDLAPPPADKAVPPSQ